MRSLVVAALEMALWNRRPAPGLIHHSDHGGQYTSLAFGRRCRQAGVVPSMGTVGDCYDNALAESFFATLECELIARGRWRTQTEARTAVFDYVEAFYNRRRRHSALAYRTPAQFESTVASTVCQAADGLNTLPSRHSRPLNVMATRHDTRRCQRSTTTA